MNPFHNLSSCFLIHFNIILPATHNLPSGLFTSGISTKLILYSY
jgi:hypothetical protein